MIILYAEAVGLNGVALEPFGTTLQIDVVEVMVEFAPPHRPSQITNEEDDPITHTSS
jgi:hypothetical protein